MTRNGLHDRVGELPLVDRPGSPAVHPPLLLLWAIGQATQGQPRLQRWSRIQPRLGELLERFNVVEDQRQGAIHPFWTLHKARLWEIVNAQAVPVAGRERRPTLATLDEVNPLAGLREDDFDQLTADRAIASEVAATLIIKFFNPMPAGLLQALGLDDLMLGRVVDWLRPRVGDRFADRHSLYEAHGGQKVMGIGPLRDGILNAFSDDKGPYRDGLIPGTDWIAYAGDGQSGDQTLTNGNRAMATHQEQQRPLRYWHKPYGGQFTLESWVVIAQRRRRWGVGSDGEQRQEFVWVLAPVPSPLKEHWPDELRAALDADSGELHDDTVDVVPAEVGGSELNPAERYRHLCAAATVTAARRNGRRSRLTTIERHFRSTAAREAVLLRSEGACENLDCLGHSSERTDRGEPILEVDHINDLARGGSDHPEFMIALCPNCHALKTRGSNREQLRVALLARARALHAAFDRQSMA